ncbi:MAG: hypothetical protein AAFX85_16295, partial [Pseudomonadota bacterium]
MSSVIIKQLSGSSPEDAERALEEVRRQITEQGLSVDNLDLLLVVTGDAKERSRAAFEQLVNERLAQPAPSVSTLAQVALNAQKRRHILRSLPCLTLDELISATDAQRAARWQEERRLFALPSDEGALFPEFQFSPDREPKPVIRELLR